MQKVKVIKATRISTGKRLLDLINGTGKTHKEFLDDLEMWKYEHPEYDEIKMPYSKDFGRWAKKNGVQMRPKRIKMFADYFNVDFEYLNCTQIEPVRNKDAIIMNWAAYDQKIDVAALAREVKELEESQKLIELLNHLNYKIDFIQNDSSISKEEFQFLDNKTIYTVEYDAPEDMLMILTYPDGSEQEITESELNSLLSDIKKYINFSMELIRKEPII